MIEPDEIHIRSSKIDGKQNIPDSLTVNSVFSNPTEEYENRTNLLTNLLGEINLLSQIVLNSQHENQAQIYDIHEVCKRILQGLTDLLNEEEDEEDICDQEFTFSSHQLIEPKEPIHGTSLNGANVNVNKQNVTSAICVPLPAACRLMELKDHENKCLEDNQEDLSTLMDISAGILRLLDVGDSNDKNINDTDSTRGNAGSTTNLSVYTTCETALHTLIRLQDAWIAAPVLVEMLSTTKCSQSTDDGGGVL
ncbi:unnamed protein product [Heterobilharzia americana]|nr:unnamed protein product [Heterobilharzia americana]